MQHDILSFKSLVKAPDEADSLAASQDVGLDIEAKLTEAILRVTEARRARAYILSGHGELAMQGNEQRAISAFVAELRRDNYEVATLNLPQEQAVPDDCNVLIVAEPTAPMKPVEIAALREYLAGGGNLFALVGARIGNSDARAFLSLLQEHNVLISNGWRIWEQHITAGLVQARPYVRSMEFGKHPITDDLDTLFVLAHNPCPVIPTTETADEASALTSQKMKARFPVSPLLLSRERSWAFPVHKTVATQDFGEQASRYLLAMAVTRAPTKEQPACRIVACGSSRILTDAVFAKEENMGNRVFALNAVNWLAQKEYKLGIMPQSTDRRILKWSPGRRASVFWIAVVGMPLAAALSGIGVWWRRRRP